MRADEWCWGPSARAFVLALALGHLRIAEALPRVARTSPSRAYAGLPRVVDFRGGDRASSRFTMLGAVDAHEILGDKVPSNRLYKLALLDRHPSFARILSLRALPPLNKYGGRPLSLGIGTFADYTRACDVRGISWRCTQGGTAISSPHGVLSVHRLRARRASLRTDGPACRTARRLCGA